MRVLGVVKRNEKDNTGRTPMKAKQGSRKEDKISTLGLYYCLLTTLERMNENIPVKDRVKCKGDEEWDSIIAKITATVSSKTAQVHKPTV